MFRKELAVVERLVASHPGARLYLDAQGRVTNGLGLVQMQSRQDTQALASFKKAVEIKEGLVARYPDIPDYKANLARSLFNLSNYLEPAETRKCLNRSQALLQELTKQYPKVDQYQEALANCYCCQCRLNEQIGELALAVEALEQAIRVQEMLRQSSDVLHHRKELFEFYSKKSLLCRKAGKREAAVDADRKARALSLDDAPSFYEYGTGLMNGGWAEEAIEMFQKAIAFKQDYAEAHCNLGLCLVRIGKFAEGRAELQRGHELGSKQPKWRYPSEQWVRNTDALIELDGKLSRILAGKDKPANDGERLALANLCQQVKHSNAAAARFFAEAFANQPKLAEDLAAHHRYNAACAAALAGCGQGADAGQLKPAERAELRKKARDWLRADLAAWTKLEPDPKQPDRLVHTLKHWQEDSDFAGVRDASALAKLPAEELEAWQKLWSEVAALLTKGQTSGR
jgi:Tfp pilus assembly protein PilF